MAVLTICATRVDAVEVVDTAADGIALNDLITHGGASVRCCCAEDM
jgi:hypothetical protein